MFHTFVFVLRRVVDRVDSFLQLIPGQQISAPPLLLHIEKVLKIPEERSSTAIITPSSLGSCLMRQMAAGE